MMYTLNGLETLPLDEPVCHVSYFEADAYARFRPTYPDALYAYEPERGPTPVNGTPGGMLVVRGKTLLDLAADDYSAPETREEARTLMRALIAERLHGQALHTRAVLRELSDL